MAGLQKKITDKYTDNPVDLTPDNLIEVVEDTGGTPTSGAAKLAQLMFNRYKLSVTVSANDLIVTLLHENGDAPSANKPLYFKIGDTIRIVSAATSITIADGTNWFNSGSAALGTKLVGYFAYVVWDSNSSIVALTIARIPYANLVSDFSATTTNEKHCFNYANFTTTDDVANIGYFEATLSLAGTSHLWTVPTFTGTNLKPYPTFVSNSLTWAGAVTSGGGAPTNPTTLTGTYVIDGRKIFLSIVVAVVDKGTATGSIFVAGPFTPLAAVAMGAVENAVTGTTCTSSYQTTPRFSIARYDGTTAWVNNYNIPSSGWALIG